MEYEQTSYSAQCGVQCPKGCTCDGTTVTCRGLQLQEIPSDIPPFTTALWVRLRSKHIDFSLNNLVIYKII